MITLWDNESQEEISSLDLLGVEGIAYSTARDRLFLITSDRVVLWDYLNEITRVEIDRYNADFRCIDISPDGYYLATGGDVDSEVDNVVYGVGYWSLSAKVRIRNFIGYSTSLKQVSFSPDGEQLATVSKSGEMIVWNINNGKRLYKLDRKVDRIIYSTDGRWLAASSLRRYIDDGKGALIILDTRNWLAKSGFGIGSAEINVMAFSPSGEQLALGLTDHQVIILGFNDESQTASFDVHSASVIALSYLGDEETLISGDNNGNIIIWKVND